MASTITFISPAGTGTFAFPLHSLTFPSSFATGGKERLRASRWRPAVGCKKRCRTRQVSRPAELPVVSVLGVGERAGERGGVVVNKREGGMRDEFKVAVTVALDGVRERGERGMKKPAAKPQLTAVGDQLETTWGQRALVGAHFAGCGALLGRAMLASWGSWSGVGVHVGMVAVSYVVTDFLVGVYHHAVDNYGSADTPIFGYQIDAFQGHHQFPWTITSRSFVNNLYRLTKPLIPQLVALWWVCDANSAYATFHTATLLFIVLAQETHRQAHMISPPAWAKTLQRFHLAVSPAAHGRHHRSPYHDNYCILSGMWNPLLDATRFFRALEALIFVLTRNEPICWRLNPALRNESLDIAKRFGLGRFI